MKKNELVYQCEKCGYLAIEPITKKDRIIHILKSALIIILIITSILGSVSIYGFIRTADFSSITNFKNIGNFWAGTLDIKSYFQSNGEMQIYAINITKECQKKNCKIEAIYNNVRENWQYEIDGTLDPYKVFVAHKGDCDTLSNLSGLLLKSIGIKSSFVCSENHCFLVVFGENKYKFDIAMGELRII